MFYTRRVCPSLSAGICFCQFWVSLIFVFCPSLVIGESTWTALCKSVLWNITTFLQHSHIQEQRRVQQVLFQTCFSFYVTSRFFLTFPSLGRIQDPSLNFFTSLHSTGKTVFFQILEWITLITLRALSYSLARYVKKCLRAILKTFFKNIESDSEFTGLPLCSLKLAMQTLAIFRANQVQKWNKVRLGYLRFPAFEALSVSCYWSRNFSTFS